MSEIIFVDDRIETRKLYSTNIEVYTGTNVVEFDDLDSAVEFLEQQIPDIIICRAKINGRSAAEKIYSILQEREATPHFFILGKCSLKYYDNATIFQKPDIKEIVQACAKVFGVTPKDMVAKDIGEFYPVSLDLILPGFQLVCSIYKMTDNGEYKEFLFADDHIYKEVIVVLRDQGIDTIYVKALDRLRFISSLTVQITEFLQNDKISLEEQLFSVEQGHQMVRNMAKKMMIDPETVQLTEASINTMMSIVDQVPTLKGLMEVTLKNNVGVMYRHCLLTSFIATHIIQQMEWGSKDQQVKITFVSFFHDIALQDDRLLLIHSKEELDESNLSEGDYQKVEEHALRAAKFLTKYYTSLPLGVDIIIKQHHGSRNGIGLDNLSQNISPLAIVFIVAEEWALFALKHEHEPEMLDRNRAIAYIRRKYQLPAFKKALATLDQLSF